MKQEAKEPFIAHLITNSKQQSEKRQPEWQIPFCPALNQSQGGSGKKP